MGVAGPPRRLQMLVRSDRRTPEKLRHAADVARGLGLEVTGVGATSLSARATHETYDRLFGAHSSKDAAAPAASTGSAELPVPPELSDFIASITEAPPHLYMDTNTNRGSKS